MYFPRKRAILGVRPQRAKGGWFSGGLTALPFSALLAGLASAETPSRHAGARKRGLFTGKSTVFSRKKANIQC